MAPKFFLIHDPGKSNLEAMASEGESKVGLSISLGLIT